MKVIPFLLIFQTCMTLNLDNFDGLVSTAFSQDCYDSSLTADGQYFYCSTLYGSELRIYQNNHSGFELVQTFDVLSFSETVCNSADGSIVMMSAGSNIYQYEQTSNGTY